MRKIFAMLVVCIIALSSTLSVHAADGKVTYSGNAGKFVFEPGSNNSLSDLFANFKSVMPGDSLTQKITVKNDAENNVKVKIYIRSLGAHQGSKDFLSKLNLKVKKSSDNQMAYMFNYAADKTDGLTDWVCLGTLYSGGEVNLDVELDVPVELGNEYQDKIGYLDWEFMIEEFPVEPDDPKPPQTSDKFNAPFWIILSSSCVAIFIVLIIFKRKTKA